MKQLSLLNNDLNKSYKTQDYILFRCNIVVYQQLMMESWENHCKILYGKLLTGKTHLAYIWQENNNATFLDQTSNLNPVTANKCYIVEDIDKITNETWLLHLFNLIKECNYRLLLTTSVLPKFLPYKLRDLVSRILSVPILKLPENNDELLRIILLKEFSTRQIKVSKKVIDYIIIHTDRSASQLFDIVNIIDSASIEAKRNITIPFIREIFN